MPQQQVVSIKNLAFDPQTLTIQVGDTVTWTNNETDGTDHTTTSDTANLWDSGLLQPGQSFSHTFPDPGTFTYHCTVHTFMTGSIVVHP